jgi:hypothetical protein
MAETIDCEKLLREIERELRGIRMQTSGVPTNRIAAMELHYTIREGLRFLDPDDPECKKLLEELEKQFQRIQMQLADVRVETIDAAISAINIRLSR